MKEEIHSELYKLLNNLSINSDTSYKFNKFNKSNKGTNSNISNKSNKVTN